MSTPDPATTYWIPLAGGGGGDVSSAVIKAPDTSARNLIQPTGPAVKPLCIKAAALQTANLFEWQNNAGTILGYIRNDGSIYAPNVLAAPNFDLRGSSDIYVSSDTGTVNLRNFNGPAGLTLLQNMHVALWNGILEFGPNPTSDTFLQRQSANNLATPGSFWAGNSIILDTNNAGAKVYWGSALDTSLYRSAAYTLKANASLLVDGAVYVNAARNANPAFRIYDMGAGGGSVMDTYCEFIWPTRAVYHFSDESNAVFHELFIRGRGTIAAPLGLQAGDYIALYGWRGYYGPNQTDNLNHASIYVQATETWTATAQGATLTFYTTPAGQSGQVASMILNGNNTYTPLLQTDRLMNIGAIPSVPTAIVRAPAAMTSNIQEWQNSSAAILGRVNKNGYYIIKQNAAIADADLLANEMTTWFDPTNTAPNFVLKAKTADGTVKTLTIPFSPSGTVFNVYKRPEDFGPVGTTNDLPVVQAAVNAAANGGCCLLSRRYVCNGPLVVPTGASILGTGPGAMLDFLNCNGLVLDDCNWMGCIEYSGFYIRGRNATDTGAVATGNFAAIYHPGNTTKPSSGGGLFGGASFSNLFFDSWGWAFRANALWRCEIRHCGGYDLYNGIECKGQSLLLNVYANRFERGSFGGKPPSGYTEGIGYYCGALTYATGGVGPPESMHVYHNMFYGFEVGIYNEHGLYHCFEFNDLDFSTKVGFRYRESMHQLVIRGHYIAMNGSSGTLVGIEGIDISSGGYVSEGSAIIEENEIWGYPSGTATCIGIRMGSTQSNAKINKNYLNGNNGGDISLLGSNANVTINDNVLDSTAPTNSFIAATGTSGEFARNKIAKPVSVNAGSTFVLYSQSGAGADAAAEGWRTISSFGAGWSAAAGYTAPRYRLVPGRKVELSGRANGASSAALAVAFTNLPAAFRPPLERAMPAMGNDQYAIVAVTNTGDIYLKSPSAQFTNMNLDSVSYSLV
jgi:hypothetical protein